MKELSIKEKELLLTDLSTRLMYGVAISQGPYDEKPIRLNSISITSIGTFFNGYFTEGIHFTFNDEGDIWPKACLRPLSSMTEEEKIEYNIIKCSICNEDDEDYAGLIDWLNAHHFDYRGLIEKGLALEYKLKN